MQRALFHKSRVGVSGAFIGASFSFNVNNNKCSVMKIQQANLTEEVISVIEKKRLKMEKKAKVKKTPKLPIAATLLKDVEGIIPKKSNKQVHT